MKKQPNTTLPEGAALINLTTQKVGAWAIQTFDAKVERLGITWYRVHRGMGGGGKREDWCAEIPGCAVSVHDYHWNGEDFGPNYGSFDAAVKGELALAVKYAEEELEKAVEKLARLRPGLTRMQEALQDALEEGAA